MIIVQAMCLLMMCVKLQVDTNGTHKAKTGLASTIMVVPDQYFFASREP
jgi:hypothetical protein